MSSEGFKEIEKQKLVEPELVVGPTDSVEKPASVGQSSAAELGNAHVSKADKPETVGETKESDSAKPSAHPDFPDLGERYEVLSLIGTGGMGSVYKVKDRALDKEFAVKVLNSQFVQDKVSVKRFEQEAEAASGLTHANLAAVYGFGLAQSGSPYLVMDYLDGDTLEKILKNEGFLDVPRALDIFIQAAEAIANAHMKGVIHRDIKPSNIIVEKHEHNIEHVKLLDFGIAKILPSEQKAHENLTQTGDIFGSPLYMSPEQCQGNMQDRRSDIYSLGCLMYEALTGVQPYAAENPIKIILKHINEEPIAISKLNRQYNIPKDLENIVMHCLERQPEHRYQSADDLLRDLRKVRDGVKVTVKAPPRQMRAPDEKVSFARQVAMYAFMIVSIFGTLAILTVVTANKSFYPDPTDPQTLDSKSFDFFNSGQYEKAAPLLEFGVASYKERIAQDKARGDSNGALRDETLLTENWQHIGKCHLAMAEKATKAGKPDEAAEEYGKAFKAFKEAMPFYYRYGHWQGSQAPEIVKDYSAVLRALNEKRELQKLTKFAQRYKLDL